MCNHRKIRKRIHTLSLIQKAPAQLVLYTELEAASEAASAVSRKPLNWD